ncbi:hypothetical protein NSND_62876 [Nitrospira sp. ND1]|nr:hypothetical protein NSND_62876 [Nitrospira sp. ND1]
MSALRMVPTIPIRSSVMKEPCRGHEGTGGVSKGQQFQAGLLSVPNYLANCQVRVEFCQIQRPATRHSLHPLQTQ